LQHFIFDSLELQVNNNNYYLGKFSKVPSLLALVKELITSLASFPEITIFPFAATLAAAFKYYF
jgi:hypothetical protein